MRGEGQGEAIGEMVRGGLYEVDMTRRRMRCVYWPEHAHRVSRGTWFVEKGTDWVPLKVCHHHERSKGDSLKAFTSTSANLWQCTGPAVHL